MNRSGLRSFPWFFYPALVLGLLLIIGPAQSDIIDTQRIEMHDGIVHYTFDVDLGPSEFDTVRLHRIVREKREGKPVATVNGIFMLPGSPNFFEMIFLPSTVSEVPAWDESIAVYLAQNDIDVWGMDYAWAFVPPDTDDFAFMEGWGLERDVGYAEQALEIARSIRLASGQGNRRMHVLGFSYGVPVAYVIAAHETQLPPGKRAVNGIIAVDFDLKVTGAAVDESCAAAANGQARIDAGDYGNPNGIFLSTVGMLAELFPNEASPIPGFTGLTNWQVAVFLGVLDSPSWHFVAGQFEGGMPIGLAFTEPELWIDLLQFVPPFVPRQTIVDVNTARCDEVDVPFDDHLGDIAVPIFAVGAAGGAAPEHHTPWLTASTDIEHLTVQFLPSELHMLDFGHGDLMMAGNAKSEVWQPILDWIIEHRSERTYR
jgi:hypothetical protein